MRANSLFHTNCHTLSKCCLCSSWLTNFEGKPFPRVFIERAVERQSLSFSSSLGLCWDCSQPLCHTSPVIGVSEPRHAPGMTETCIGFVPSSLRGVMNIPVSQVRRGSEETGTVSLWQLGHKLANAQSQIVTNFFFQIEAYAGRDGTCPKSQYSRC